MALRAARTCYDHLAGRLGVALADALQESGHVLLQDGTGLITDSGWRLTCWITVPAHVLGTHVLAVATLAIAGAGLGVVVDRLRS